MSTCYRKYKDTTHKHFGPTFSRCSKCKQIVCDDCIAKHLSSSQVVCVECVQSYLSRQYNRLREQPWEQHRDRSIAIARVAQAGMVWLFVGVTSSIYKILWFMTVPFRLNNRQYQVRRNPQEYDFYWTSYGDKVRSAYLFIGTAVAIALVGVIYAIFRQIPVARVFISISLTILFWAILVIYLQYIFEPALSRPVSQIVSYSASFFLSLIFGAWLINLELIDKIINGLGI